MRYRIRGNVMHCRTLILAICLWLVYDSTFLNVEATRILRRRSTTTTTSTPAPITFTFSTSNSTTTTTIKPEVSSVLPGFNAAKKLRRRKTRVLQKRNGGLASSGDLSGDYEEQLDREALYGSLGNEFDDVNYNAPAHYYSPSKLQKQRKRLRDQAQNQNPAEQHRRYTLSSPSGSSYSSPNYNSPTPNPADFEEGFQQQPAPKNYAFAYAVTDNKNSEDFSHKEARDGKLTMGEYRINLPDGRVQVVRYTAGGKLGYKADVTYEKEDDPSSKKLPNLVKPKNVAPTPGPPYYDSPKSLTHRKFAIPQGPNYFDPPPSNKGYDDSFGSSRPLKSHRPSLSPSSTYSGYSGGSDDYSRPQDYPLTSSQDFELKAGPSYRSRNPPPTLPSYYGPNPIQDKAKSRRDKNPRKKKPKYNGNLSFLHEQSPRAGPARPKKYNSNQQLDESPSNENFYPADQPSYNGQLKYFSPSTSRPSSNTRQNSAEFDYNYERKPSKPRSRKPRISKKQRSSKPRYNNNYDKPPRDSLRSSSPSRPPSSNNNRDSRRSSKTSRPSQQNDIDHNPVSLSPSRPNYFESAVQLTPRPERRRPSKPQYFDQPTFEDQLYPSSPRPQYFDSPNEGPYPSSPSKPSYFEDNQVGPSPYKTQVNPTRPVKGNLIPIEDFKAGPSTKRPRKTNYNNNKPSGFSDQEDFGYPQSAPILQNPDYENQNQIQNTPSRKPSYRPLFSSTPGPVRYQEPFHYYNSQHPSFQHGGYDETNDAPLSPEPTLPPQSQEYSSQSPVLNSQNPTASSYSIDYPGGKHNFYLKTSSGKPKKNSGGNNGPSGIVYLETPGEGPRPSSQGVKEAMERLPNMPPSNPTSVYPYEVGAKDYGSSVGYKNSESDNGGSGPSDVNNNVNNGQDDNNPEIPLEISPINPSGSPPEEIIIPGSQPGGSPPPANNEGPSESHEEGHDHLDHYDEGGYDAHHYSPQPQPYSNTFNIHDHFSSFHKDFLNGRQDRIVGVDSSGSMAGYENQADAAFQFVK